MYIKPYIYLFYYCHIRITHTLSIRCRLHKIIDFQNFLSCLEIRQDIVWKFQNKVVLLRNPYDQAHCNHTRTYIETRKHC